jgi:O-antigen/teichoic acid export membrane protein
LSFIKQVFNYIFVAHEKQNKLLGINAFWVIVGLSLWLYLIPNFQIIWGIYTQVLLEIMFVSWSLFVAYRNRLLPKLNWERLGTLLWFSLITFWVWYYIIGDNYTNIFQFLLIATILNIPGILLALPIIKKVSIGLTQKVSSNSEN